MKKFLAYTIAGFVGLCAIGPIGLIAALVIVWLVFKQS